MRFQEFTNGSTYKPSSRRYIVGSSNLAQRFKRYFGLKLWFVVLTLSENRPGHPGALFGD